MVSWNNFFPLLKISDLSHQINQLEEQLASKTNDIQLMQNELKMVKEFRKKRATMQKELDEVAVCCCCEGMNLSNVLLF